MSSESRRPAAAIAVCVAAGLIFYVFPLLGALAVLALLIASVTPPGTRFLARVAELGRRPVVPNGVARREMAPVPAEPETADIPCDCRVAVVIPAYRARATIAGVVESALRVADLVIVVDDACPDRCGDLVRGAGPRVRVLRHEVNRGVGGATKTGIVEALRLGARYVVKLDADDQMDTAFVPEMIAALERFPEVDLVKGNRFADPSTLRTMPAARLIGNAGLTLMIKFSSGYWTIVDPTNGFLALRADAVREPDLAGLAERYFFEIDLLCMLGLRRRTIAELEMPAIYAGEHSSLSIPNVLFTFPPRLAARFLRRLLVNYLVVEINLGSLCGIVGIPLLLFAVLFGAHEWAVSLQSGIERPTGTIVLALLLFMTGFQLSLQALMYDVQSTPRTLKLRPSRGHGVREAEPVRTS
ncbi:MAG TPA: glycosyltransferase family 2 protein [Candidatus Elarobacter sp.]|jgi:glycosyltransferase involved in cell wall biosynthesis|nr:glycosyltransferase family 2 protein [Candidatus Elarobacter sp.]